MHDFLGPNDLFNPPGYPTAAWHRQAENYREWMRYFDGGVLEDVEESADGYVKKYPVGINYCRTVALLNSYAMIGDWRDDVLTWQRRDGSTAPGAIDYLSAVARQSRLNSRYIRQVLTHTVLGGCVWGIKKNPLLPTKLQWVVVPPELFLPVWSSYDDELLECFIRTHITGREAKLLWQVQTSEDRVEYVEHWTRERYEIHVNRKAVLSGRTPGGVIPYEYIPRLNVAGEFYGISVIQDLMSLQDEINALMGDIGDAVNRETHKETLVSNLPGGIKGIRRGNGYVDLGMGLGNAKPEVHNNEKAQIPAGAMDSIALTLDFARYATGTPPVAFGEDEGSQRSSQTLTVRMWPLIQAAKNNRAFLVDGLARLATKTLRVAGELNLTGFSLEDGYYEPSLPPILPKDREQIVNEVSVLRAAELLGDEQALEILDVPEPDRPAWLAGIEALRQAAKELAQTQAQARAAAAPTAKTTPKG